MSIITRESFSYIHTTSHTWFNHDLRKDYDLICPLERPLWLNNILIVPFWTLLFLIIRFFVPLTVTLHHIIPHGTWCHNHSLDHILNELNMIDIYCKLLRWLHLIKWYANYHHTPLMRSCLPSQHMNMPIVCTTTGNDTSCRNINKNNDNNMIKMILKRMIKMTPIMAIQ